MYRRETEGQLAIPGRLKTATAGWDNKMGVLKPSGISNQQELDVPRVRTFHCG